MRTRFLIIILLLLIPVPSSGYYRESVLFTTYDDTDYYYTAETSYSTYYIGEILDIDIELVVDYFGIDSYSFFDIELWISLEDSSGFIYFEDSHYSGLDISFDGDGVVVEWDIDITADFPTTLYVLVAGDFYEDTIYEDVFYEDEWLDIMTLTIRDGERPVRTVDFPQFVLIGGLGLVVLLIRHKRDIK